MAGVASVLALSAMTIRQENGSSALRKRCSLRMLRSSAACSLKTGTTISTLGATCRGPGGRVRDDGRRSVWSVMATASARDVGPGGRRLRAAWESVVSAPGGAAAVDHEARRRRPGALPPGAHRRRRGRRRSPPRSPGRGRRRPCPRSRPPSARQKRSNSASASLVGQARAVVADLEAHRRRRRAPGVTSIGVPAGVWTSALRSRLPSTWRSWSASPTTSAGPSTSSAISRSGRGRARVVDGVAGQRGEVEPRVRRVGHLVEAGQRQQVLDEHAHARGLVLDAPHRLLDVGRARAPRPCGTARRSRGSRPAACAARARRRR